MRIQVITLGRIVVFLCSLLTKNIKYGIIFMILFELSLFDLTTYFKAICA